MNANNLPGGRDVRDPKLVEMGGKLFLYAISRGISEAGANIELAHVATEEGEARDSFYLTESGGKLDASAKARVERALRSRNGPG